MAAEDLAVVLACRVLAVSESGYYAQHDRPPSARAIRHTFLTALIRRVHLDSRASYGARRVHAELVLGQGLLIGRCAVELLMRRAGIAGASGRPQFRRIPNVATAADLVERRFGRDEPDRLWVTDITEHPTREGKVYCAVVLDVFSRRVVGWSIDATQTAALVTNALGMAIEGRRPDGTVIHSDQGTQFTSWAFTRRALDSGLMPSMGSVGSCFDNAMIESFWSRMQVELLDRRIWRTRVELANAIFEYLEIFHNRQRRHSALGMLTPVEFETRATAPDRPPIGAQPNRHTFGAIRTSQLRRISSALVVRDVRSIRAYHRRQRARVRRSIGGVGPPERGVEPGAAFRRSGRSDRV